MIGWFKNYFLPTRNATRWSQNFTEEIYEDIWIDESYRNNPTFATDVP